MGDVYNWFRLLGYQSHMNGHVSVSGKEAERQREVIIASVHHMALVNDNILSTVCSQQLRQQTLKSLELARPLVVRDSRHFNGRCGKGRCFAGIHGGTSEMPTGALFFYTIQAMVSSQLRD
jgi:hypothetical protein